jgi:hypothetical protein
LYDDDSPDLKEQATPPDTFLPRCFRGFGWHARSPTSSHTAHCTEVDSPLPRPPASEYQNIVAMNTIRDNPHLFSVSTEIRADRLHALLQTHPNPAYRAC